MKQVQSGKFVEYIAGLHETHGPTFKEKMIGNNLISTIEPANLKALLATQFTDFGLGIRHRQFYPLLGDGIFTLDGIGWSAMRALIRPQFAREQIADLALFDHHVTQLITVLPGDKSAINIQELFYQLTIDSATEFLFGESTACLHASSIQPAATVLNSPAGFADAFNTSQDYLLRRALAQRLCWTINPARFRDANATVHRVVDHYVQRALQSKHAGAGGSRQQGQGQGRYVFLEALASQTDDPKVIRDNLLNVLLAGRNTTASLLSSVFYFLARNPRVWATLHEEIVGAFGDRHTHAADKNEITHARLKNLTYLRYVLNETLRLLPPVPVNFRQAVRDTSLPVGGGRTGRSPIYIRRGDMVGYNVYAMHRRTDTWGADAHVFRPERWGENPPRGWEFLPFNGGPRICLGQQYALVEAGYTTARHLQEFDVLENAQLDPGAEP
ncbi:cytochrome P450 [Aspergillus carlsbadensis]|nr:cytochrome P450 [Aspergillus carlsbadensis]